MRNFYLFPLLIIAFLPVLSATAEDGIPAAVQSVKIVEDKTPGEVTLSWPAVTRDVMGLALSSGGVTYNVYGYNANDEPIVKVASDVKDTSYTFQAYSGAGQKFVRYFVAARTSAGEGEGVGSESIPVGEAYTDFHATFADGKSKYVWGSGELPEGVMIGLLTDKSGYPAQDGDNGFLAMQGSQANTYASIRSGKISLANMDEPVMVFYTYNFGSNVSHDENIVVVKIRVAGSPFDEVYSEAVWELAHDVSGWAKVTVDLADYIDQDIQFEIGGTFVTDGAFLFDNISFPEMPKNDLTLVGLSAPSCAVAGTDVDVTVTVVNNGANAADNWKVVLIADGKEVMEKDGEKLVYGESQDVTLAYHLSAVAEDPVYLTARVECPTDGELSDNETKESFKLTPAMSQLPYVKKISGSVVGSDVELSWTAPDLEATPRMITEDFETGNPFTAEFGKWTFVDADGQPLGGFRNVSIPNIIPGETTGSFWVWDTEAKLANAQGHSGTKFLFAMYRQDDGKVDDWAISPELYPAAQTVSFYAASWTMANPETVEVWYSMGSKDIKDFVKVAGAGGEVPEGATTISDWTYYEAALPEGAKYFAIRSCGTNTFMLMIDDVTFRPQRADLGMTMEGFNVYRDGEKINDAVVTGTSYVDKTCDENATYEYQVTTVFSGGESRGSKVYKVELGAGSVEGIEADETPANSRIYDLMGREVKQMIPGSIYIRGNKKIIKRT